MDFKIEKNVPRNPIKKEPKIIYPFSEMLIGDSFFVPEKGFAKRKEQSVRSNITNQLKMFNISNQKNYTVSIKKTEGGLRVWRNT